MAEWMEEGDARLEKRVRRAIVDANDEVTGFADGTVTGFLPSELSDYISEFTGQPAALWHIKYDASDMGEEDLEEVEVDDAIEAFASKTWSTADNFRQTSERRRQLREKFGSGKRGGSIRCNGKIQEGEGEPKKDARKEKEKDVALGVKAGVRALADLDFLNEWQAKGGRQKLRARCLTAGDVPGQGISPIAEAVVGLGAVPSVTDRPLLFKCWECRRGKFRAYKCSVKQCRSPKGSGVNNAQGHTGPNWMDDPRELMYLATYGPLSHNNGRGARGDAEGAAARAEAEKKRRRRGEQRAGVQNVDADGGRGSGKEHEQETRRRDNAKDTEAPHVVQQDADADVARVKKKSRERSHHDTRDKDEGELQDANVGGADAASDVAAASDDNGVSTNMSEVIPGTVPRLAEHEQVVMEEAPTALASATCGGQGLVMDDTRALGRERLVAENSRLKAALKAAQDALAQVQGRDIERLSTEALRDLQTQHEQALAHIARELLSRQCDEEVAAKHPEFVCPLRASNLPVRMTARRSSVLMADPVVAADGHTYERANIVAWLQERRDECGAVSSPKTGELLSSSDVMPNLMAKQAIAQALKDARTRLQAEACEREPAIQLRLSDGASLAEPLAEDGGGADVNRRREEERDKDVRMEAVAGRGASESRGDQGKKQTTTAVRPALDGTAAMCGYCGHDFAAVPQAQRNAVLARHANTCAAKTAAS